MLGVLLLGVLGWGVVWNECFKVTFDGEGAFGYVEKQLSFGSRCVGTDGHDQIVKFIKDELELVVDDVSVQEFKEIYNEEEYSFVNIVAQINPEVEERIILGTHYDSRYRAELDMKNPQGYMPGANDSASGTAVLLQLAKEIDQEKLRIGIDLVFFDGEEGFPVENLEDWYPIGSKYFAENLDQYYKEIYTLSGVVVDMIGDNNLDIHIENFSYQYAPVETKAMYYVGMSVFPFDFVNDIQHSIIDDHTALNEAGIPTVLLIDFEYPYFHTTEDTLDKVSSESLEKIGVVLLKYIDLYGRS